MRWHERLERRLGFLAVPGLGRALVAIQVLCFVGALLDPAVYGALPLVPSLVARGQFWRLATFLFLPSLSPLNVLFAVFYFLFQWAVYDALEAQWGAFRLTLYCVLGWLFALALPLGAYVAWGADGPSTGLYWSTSVLLAFATEFPDTTIQLYLVLPVKMRWMGWLIAAFLAYQILVGGWPELLGVGFGLANYLLFYAGDLGRAVVRRRDRARFESALRAASSGKPRSCAQCGAGPEAFLRLCTCGRCGAEGRFWCDAHLATHLSPAAGVAPEPETEPAAAAPTRGSQARTGATGQKKGPGRARARGRQPR